VLKPRALLSSRLALLDRLDAEVRPYGRGCLVVWGPALDRAGKSVAGVEALDRFTTVTGWSVS
jgi:hypothetical protein